MSFPLDTWLHNTLTKRRSFPEMYTYLPYPTHRSPWHVHHRTIHDAVQASRSSRLTYRPITKYLPPVRMKGSIGKKKSNPLTRTQTHGIPELREKSIKSPSRRHQATLWTGEPWTWSGGGRWFLRNCKELERELEYALGMLKPSRSGNCHALLWCREYRFEVGNKEINKKGVTPSMTNGKCPQDGEKGWSACILEDQFASQMLAMEIPSHCGGARGLLDSI